MTSFLTRSSCAHRLTRAVRTQCRRAFASWEAEVSNPRNQFQIYTSSSTDPYVNLSIEHHFFQKSPPGSKILFLYVNRPCIVIGRNQNPWLEVNLALQRSSHERLGNIDLVRRRSGGGTVFHDGGNVNWSVICDFTEFTRDKHGEMVVRALREIGIARARVNERHDIVLDQGPETHGGSLHDTHATAFTSSSIKPLKVSGSAYKMARNRALHHGTALLNTPNLSIIPDYLHSPARGHIQAKGVESVSSPVGNIGLSNKEFMEAVTEQFRVQYKVPQIVTGIDVDNSALDVEEIRAGNEEMTSLDWTYLQTPQFTVSTKRHDQDSEEKEPSIAINVRNGEIHDCRWLEVGDAETSEDRSNTLRNALKGLKLHHIQDWGSILRPHLPATLGEEQISTLERLIPTR